MKKTSKQRIYRDHTLYNLPEVRYIVTPQDIVKLEQYFLKTHEIQIRGQLNCQMTYYQVATKINDEVVEATGLHAELIESFLFDILLLLHPTKYEGVAK